MVKEIPIWNSKNLRWEKILIDLEDWERLKQYKYHFDKDNAVIINPTENMEKTVLSRFILNVTNPKIKVDHKNHSKLDNRKENLRIATHQQNMWNQKPKNGKLYKGVTLDKRYDRYSARIRVTYKTICLGYFSTPEKAAKAYDKAAIKYFGEFAYLNFPEKK